jgi:2,3-diketo-5-methylthio-1-phosphopentane phosphatase
MPERTADYRVFIDFDNTITDGDVLDGVIATFAIDESWRRLEEDWMAGRIGTRVCLEGQMRGLRATWEELAANLAGVKLDPGFAILRRLLQRERIELTIVSDNFDLIVGHVLERHGLADVPFFANHLVCAGGRLQASFPFANPDCPDCAHCKKTHFIPPHDDGRRVIYVGDGRSDICPARAANIVYAKDSLLTHLRSVAHPCIPFGGLADVAESLTTLLHEN